jgi:hypothetical protein
MLSQLRAAEVVSVSLTQGTAAVTREISEPEWATKIGPYDMRAASKNPLPRSETTL